MDTIPVNFQPQRRNPFQMAVEALRAKGHQVIPAEIPGLIYVDGQELTIGQVIQILGIDPRA